jgi:hypothetical protein
MCDDDAHHHLLAASSEQENRAIANILPAARIRGVRQDDHGLRRRGEYPRVGSVHSRMDFIPH